MADASRGPSPDLERDLFANAPSFGFFQAMRLLRLLFTRESGHDTGTAFFRENLRVRPHLSLSFPGTDLTRLEKDEKDGRPLYRSTVSFLGLYGSSSPLPTFYTEDLIDQVTDDVTVVRDFVDIVNSPFYPLLIQAWLKYRLFFQVDGLSDKANISRLFCLFGLGSVELRDRVTNPRRLLRYIGLFSLWPRSATGLKTLISDVLGGAKVSVIPNLERRVPIPGDQRCLLGLQAASLGSDVHIGREIADRQGRFALAVGPLDEETFHGCLPGTETFAWVEELLRLYLAVPLDCRLEISLRREEVSPARLGGGKWSVLGHDAWIYSRTQPEQCRAVFHLKAH